MRLLRPTIQIFFNETTALPYHRRERGVELTDIGVSNISVATLELAQSPVEWHETSAK